MKGQTNPSQQGKPNEMYARAASVVCNKNPAAGLGVEASAIPSFFAFSLCRSAAERVIRPPSGMGPNLAPLPFSCLFDGAFAIFCSGALPVDGGLDDGRGSLLKPVDGVASAVADGRLGVTASAYTEGVFGRTASADSAVMVVSGSSALEAREDPEGSLEASESGVRGESGDVGGGVVRSGVCGAMGCDEGRSSTIGCDEGMSSAGGSGRGLWPIAGDCAWSVGRGAMRRTGDRFEGDRGIWLKSITGAEGQIGTDCARRDLEGVSSGFVCSRMDDAEGGR